MFDELMRAAIERDTAAREIFASLSAKEPMGHAEVCEALLAAVQTTTFASGASTDRTVVKDSPMTHRHIMSEPYVREFVCNKYDGRLADYEDFVALHNQLVELQMRSAAFQTARNGYTVALKDILEKGESGDDDSADVSLPDELTFD